MYTIQSESKIKVGVVQFMMGFFRLGFVTAYLSEPLVNSFLGLVTKSFRF